MVLLARFHRLPTCFASTGASESEFFKEVIQGVSGTVAKLPVLSHEIVCYSLKLEKLLRTLLNVRFKLCSEGYHLLREGSGGGG